MSLLPRTAAQYFGSADHIANIAGHALVGCASSAAGGGDCKSGAFAGGLSASAGPLLVGKGVVAGTSISAVVGGAGSYFGGGKFVNGAVTGAYGYLFNATFATRRDGTTGLDHILDRHGDPYAQQIDPTAGQFTAEYSTPQALNDLADQVIGAPDGSVLQKNNNTLQFGTVWLVNQNTGARIPYIIGTTGSYGWIPSVPTNIVGVVTNPKGEVVTMFPTSAAYAASKGIIIPAK